MGGEACGADLLSIMFGLSEFPEDYDRWADHEPDCNAQFNMLEPQGIKQDICTESLNTYDSVTGFSLGCHSGMASASDS